MYYLCTSVIKGKTCMAKKSKDQTGEKAYEKKSEEKKPAAERDERGRFKKGSKRPEAAGRKMGTKNRNSNVRDRLKEQLEPFIDNIGEMIARIKTEEGTKEAAYVLEKFMPYFVPKYSSVNITAEDDTPISEEQRLLELDAKYTKKELSINIKSVKIVDNDVLRADEADPDEDMDFDLSQFDTVDQ